MPSASRDRAVQQAAGAPSAANTAVVRETRLEPADVVALQRSVGNQALIRVLARNDGAGTGNWGTARPKDQTPPDPRRPPPVPTHDPAWLHGTPKDHMPGDPVEGYETPRGVYTDTDRKVFEKAVKDRRIANETTVEKFLGDWSAALLELWSANVSETMAKAAAHSSLDFWGKLAAFVIEKSVLALATSGAGIVWAAAADVELPFFAEKTIGFANKLASGKVVGAITGENVGPKLEQAKQTLDAKTKQLARMVREMHAASVLDTPWEDYLLWVHDAPLADLGRFRLPKRLPEIPEDEIRASVAAAIVAALHEPHSHDDLPVRTDPRTREHTTDDPTADDPISIFDDNIAIVHMKLGDGRRIEASDAEIYTPSKVLLDVLVGRTLREMPGVPLFILIDPPAGGDLAAARELLNAIRKAGPTTWQADHPGREGGDDSSPARSDDTSAAAFAAAYNRNETVAQMRIVRSPKWSTGLWWRGGGLAEAVWFRGWADTDLSRWAAEIWRRAEVAAIEDAERLDKKQPLEESPPNPSIDELVTYAQHEWDYWAGVPATDPSPRFVSEHVLQLTAATPENRWSSGYWTKDRRRLFDRDLSRISPWSDY